MKTCQASISIFEICPHTGKFFCLFKISFIFIKNNLLSTFNIIQKISIIAIYNIKSFLFILKILNNFFHKGFSQKFLLKIFSQ
jgi:hypothetical protein